MCTGAEIAALTAAAGATAGTAGAGAAAAAAPVAAGTAAATGAGLLSTLPLIEAAAVPAELGAASALALAPELEAGLYAGMGVDKLAAAGGAASELGATSSSIGAAGQAANPLSVMYGNFATSPLGSGIGRGIDTANKARSLGLLGGRGGGGGVAAPAPHRSSANAPIESLADILKKRYGLLGRRATGGRYG